MKKILFVTLIALGFSCATPRAVLGEEAAATNDVAKSNMIVYPVQSLKFNQNNFDDLLKIFKDDKYARPMPQLADTETETLKNMFDYNRFPVKVKPVMRTKEDFFSSDAMPGMKQETIPVIENKQIANDAKNDVSFAVICNDEGLVFLVKSPVTSNGIFEVSLQPLEAGKFGNDGFHFFMNQTDGAITNIVPTYDPRMVIKGHQREIQRINRETNDGYVISAFSVPWEVYYRLTGDLPFKYGRKTMLRLSVYRWADGKGYSWKGLPYDSNANTYILMPEFTPKRMTGIKGGMFERLLGPYFTDPSGKGHDFNSYFNAMQGHYSTAAFWNERFKVPNRLSFTHFYSNRYMVEQENLIEDYKKNMIKVAQDAKDLLENPYAIELILKYDYDHFLMRENEYQAIRYKAMRDRVFSDKFTED